MKSKSKKTIIMIITVIIFMLLWFSEFLPKQVVRVVADYYLSRQEDSKNYRFINVEYSAAYDCYFAYYYKKEAPNGETRNIGVYYRWLPFQVYFDSAYPG